MIKFSKSFSRRESKMDVTVIFIVLLFFSIGIAAGAFILRALSTDQKKELLLYINKFFKALSLEGVDKAEVFVQSIKNNALTIFLIWIFGATVVGVPISVCITTFRGFIIGFTISFFIDSLGYKGILFSLFSIIPQNIIYIPCILIATGISLLYSFQVIKRRTKKNNYYGRKFTFINYSLFMLTLLIIMTVGSLIEAYFVPVLIKTISNYMLS